jgi:hypothetical protein
VLINILDSSDTLTVQNGQFTITITNGLESFCHHTVMFSGFPKVYYPQNSLADPAFGVGKNIPSLFTGPLGNAATHA